MKPGQFDPFGQLRDRVYEVIAGDAVGMTVSDLEARFDVKVKQAAHLEKRIDVTPDLTFQAGYRIALQGKLGDVFKAGGFLGHETTNLSTMGFVDEERDVVVTNRQLQGKTIADGKELLDLKHGQGIWAMATRLRRLDQEIEMYPQTEVQSGDVVRLIGAADDVEAAAAQIGYSLVPTKIVDYVYLGLGVLAGILLGMITVSVSGVPVGLGTGGGCLISGLIFGWLRAKKQTFGNLLAATAQYLRDFGLAVFIASVGLATGPQAIAQIKQFGVTMPILGSCASLFPCLVMVFLRPVYLENEPRHPVRRHLREFGSICSAKFLHPIRDLPLDAVHRWHRRCSVWYRSDP
jgi:putative transport protein